MLFIRETMQIILMRKLFNCAHKIVKRKDNVIEIFLDTLLSSLKMDFPYRFSVRNETLHITLHSTLKLPIRQDNSLS